MPVALAPVRELANGPPVRPPGILVAKCKKSKNRSAAGAFCRNIALGFVVMPARSRGPANELSQGFGSLNHRGTGTGKQAHVCCKTPMSCPARSFSARALYIFAIMVDARLPDENFFR
jgi:hypothetical protein